MMTDALISVRAGGDGGILGLSVAAFCDGSMGFIPYFAAAIVVPAWPSVVCVVVVKTAVEVWTGALHQGDFERLRARDMELSRVDVYLALGGVGLRASTTVRSDARHSSCGTSGVDRVCRRAFCQRYSSLRARSR